jgi:hypothetical protein
MKGKQKGRPTKWVTAYIPQLVEVGKPGFIFYIDEKWKQNQKKLGTLTVSVGGLRWRPRKGKFQRWRNWDEVINWIESKG